jgi:hypothetical protein
MSAIADAIHARGGRLFVPLVYRMAARLEQLEVAEMLADPAAAAFVLRGARQLLNLPAIVNHFQLGLELEAHGARVHRTGTGAPVSAEGGPRTLTPEALGEAPLAAVLDTATRLATELRGEADVLGVLTGPATLQWLAGDEPAGLSEFYAALARHYAEAGVAALLIVEAEGRDAPSGSETCRELCNIARFYRIPTVLLTGDEPNDAQFDLVVTRARAVPPSALLSTPETSFCPSLHGVLLTAGEVPEDTPPETVAAWVRALSEQMAGGVR